jgi:Animal haem peroxidase
MSPIRSSHNLLNSDEDPSAGTQTSGSARGQSRYTYLFPDLVGEPLAGCFAGTSERETADRLRAFEVASRVPLSASPVLRMRLPAAYTYFGQFVNHDISAPVGDVVARSRPASPSGIVGAVDPPGLDRDRRSASETILESLINEHAAPLSLASLYGDGPSSSDPQVAALYTADGLLFRLATTSVAPDSFFSITLGIPAETVVHASGARDIPRKNRKPLIADHRNDENVIISQLHLAMMLFHNKAVVALKPHFADRAQRFREARRLVTRHYQWLILNDYLPSLLSREVLRRPLAEWPSRLTEMNAVPLEFTTAAFRFGHSMVGSAYDFNANFGIDGRISATGASLEDLFAFTSHKNMQSVETKTLRLPDHWVIDWDRMTRDPGLVARNVEELGGAEPIDMNFAREMLTIIGDSNVAVHGSILFRNLMRGFHRRIPFGQRLAQQYGVTVLTEDEVRQALPEPLPGAPATENLRQVAEDLGMLNETPAWLYFLCESKAHEAGQRLGATSSHIIADTITGIMNLNPESVLNYEGGIWHPRDSILRGQTADGLTTIRDFLLFAVEDTAVRRAGQI